VGVPITPNTPTVTGTVDLYYVPWSPLPRGFQLDELTGTISGFPESVQAARDYIIYAQNRTGIAQATITITVNEAPPSQLRYPQTFISAVVGQAIAPNVPTFEGDVEAFSVAPALPAGLTLDSSKGIISGTPRAPSAPATYVVTASNGSGNISAKVNISVVATPTTILNLGHASAIAALRTAGDRVLSEDVNGHWVLWDYIWGDMILSGDGANQIDLAGQVAVVSVSDGIEVLSKVDGHLIFTIPRGSWWRLALDGSYICVGSDTGITVWSTSGSSVFSRAGHYANAIAFVAPGQVQIAGGPAGQYVIETIEVPSGSSSISSMFSGVFHSWFSDGRRFLTTFGNQVSVYSNLAVLQGSMALASINYLTGQGDWVWTAAPSTPHNSLSQTMQVFAIGSATPVASFYFWISSSFVPSGTMVGVFEDNFAHFTTIDLSGATPLKTVVPAPPQDFPFGSFAAASASQWILGNGSGVLLDGASASSSPRTFGYGAAVTIAGASNIAAVATASGKVAVFDVAGLSMLGSFYFPAGKLALSSSGSILGAAPVSDYWKPITDRTLNFYSLPSMSIAYSFPYSYSHNSTTYLSDFTLAGSGTTMGQVLVSSEMTQAAFSREVSPISGAPLIWLDYGSGTPILLSPDGTLFAVSNGAMDATGSTEIFKNGNLSTTVSGIGVGWIDNERLLVDQFAGHREPGPPEFTGAVIFNANGTKLTEMTTCDSIFYWIDCPERIPPTPSPQFLISETVYDPGSNAIYSLATGLLVWRGPRLSDFPSPHNIGAVAGQYVVNQVNNRIVLYPR